MKQDIDVRLTFGSWVYLAGLVGLCGGFVVALISAIWSAVHGEWLEAIVILVTGPISGLQPTSIWCLCGTQFKRRAGANNALKVDARNARALNADVSL